MTSDQDVIVMKCIVPSAHVSWYGKFLFISLLLEVMSLDLRRAVAFKPPSTSSDFQSSLYAHLSLRKLPVSFPPNRCLRDVVADKKSFMFFFLSAQFQLFRLFILILDSFIESQTVVVVNYYICSFDLGIESLEFQFIFSLSLLTFFFTRIFRAHKKLKLSVVGVAPLRCFCVPKRNLRRLLDCGKA